MALVPSKSSNRHFSLIPEISPLEASRWIAFVEDSETSSYSYLLRQCDDELSQQMDIDSWFRKLHPMQLKNEDAWTDSFYKGELLLRKTAWVVLDERCMCEYGYSDTWQEISKSSNLGQVLAEITEHIKRVTGDYDLNCCNLNYYPTGGGVGFHADDEYLFDGTNRPTRIVSLSLCNSPSTQRVFQVKPQLGLNEDEAAQDKSNNNLWEISLGHGDLLTMEGMFQKHYYHSVWPGDSKGFLKHPRTQGERINLTWRTIVQHLDGSPQCRGKRCPLADTTPTGT